MECEFPTINTDSKKYKEIFNNTKTIAVVGCSPKEDKDSHRVSKYLLNAGFNMIPIYPKEEKILGQQVYRSLLDIKENIDMVIVFRKSAAVADVVNACIKKGGIKYLWTQIGIVNNDAAQKALDNDIKVVQSKCSMVEHRKLF